MVFYPQFTKEWHRLWQVTSAYIASCHHPSTYSDFWILSWSHIQAMGGTTRERGWLKKSAARGAMLGLQVGDELFDERALKYCLATFAEEEMLFCATQDEEDVHQALAMVAATALLRWKPNLYCFLMQSFDGNKSHRPISIKKISSWPPLPMNTHSVNSVHFQQYLTKTDGSWAHTWFIKLIDCWHSAQY